MNRGEGSRYRQLIQQFSELTETELSERWSDMMSTYDYTNENHNIRHDALLFVIETHKYWRAFLLNRKPSPTTAPGYPDFYDPLFFRKIYAKKEFFLHRFRYVIESPEIHDSEVVDDKKIQADKLLNQVCSAADTNDFIYLPHQRFLRNYLSAETPYRGVLLFQGVGTGKTCTSVNIAEEFLTQEDNRRVMVMIPKAIQSQFEQTIFKLDNVELANDGVAQIIRQSCSGRRYIDQLEHERYQTLEQLQREILRKVKRSYEFTSYKKFAYDFQRLMSQVFVHHRFNQAEFWRVLAREVEIRYSDTLILIDEVHRLRTEKNFTQDQEFAGIAELARLKYKYRLQDEDEIKGNELKITTISAIRKILRWARNIKLVLMSATPIFDRYDEMIPIINLLLINDGRAPLPTDLIFKKSGDFIQRENLDDLFTHPEKYKPHQAVKKIIGNGTELFKQRIRGYISYLRGETPWNFPVRLYPRNAKKYPGAEFDLYGERIRREYALNPQIFPLFTSKYSELQMRFMESLYEMLEEDVKKQQEVARQRQLRNQQKQAENRRKLREAKVRPVIEGIEIGADIEFNIENGEFIEDEDEIENEDENEIEVEDDMKEEKKSSSSDSFVVREFDDDLNEDLPPGFTRGPRDIAQWRYASNMVFPSKKTELECDVGKSGFENVMFRLANPQVSKGIFGYRKNFTPNEYIYRAQNIGKYSGKLAAIWDIIRQSEGIIFIYSEYLSAGGHNVALMLEQNGFARIGHDSEQMLGKDYKTPETGWKPICFCGKYADEHTKTSDHIFTQAHYTYLTGNFTFSPHNNKDIAILKDIANKDGSKIKVIIGSAITKEGIDFHNIRQVHILDPWYNTNSMEQIIGRGIRFCKHTELDISKRNCTVFHHTGINSLDGYINNKRELQKRESIDEWIYRLAQNKGTIMGRIYRLMKENAVDVYLNYKANLLEGNTFVISDEGRKIRIIDAYEKDAPKSLSDAIKQKKVWTTFLKDRPWSFICDFQSTCEFIPEDLKPRKGSAAAVAAASASGSTAKQVTEFVSKFDKLIPNSYAYDDTYVDTFIEKETAQIWFWLPNLFNKTDLLGGPGQKIYHIDDFIGEIRRKFPRVSREELEKTIERWINRRETFYDARNSRGYLVRRGQFILFQPISIDYEGIGTFERENMPIMKQHGVRMDVGIDEEGIAISDTNEMIIEKFRQTWDIVRSDIHTDIMKSIREICEILEYNEPENILAEMWFDSYITTGKEVILAYIYTINDRFWIDRLEPYWIRKNMVGGETTDREIVGFRIEKNEGKMVYFYREDLEEENAELQTHVTGFIEAPFSIEEYMNNYIRRQKQSEIQARIRGQIEIIKNSHIFKVIDEFDGRKRVSRGFICSQNANSSNNTDHTRKQRINYILYDKYEYRVAGKPDHEPTTKTSRLADFLCPRLEIVLRVKQHLANKLPVSRTEKRQRWFYRPPETDLILYEGQLMNVEK